MVERSISWPRPAEAGVAGTGDFATDAAHNAASDSLLGMSRVSSSHCEVRLRFRVRGSAGRGSSWGGPVVTEDVFWPSILRMRVLGAVAVSGLSQTTRAVFPEPPARFAVMGNSAAHAFD